MLSNNEEKTKWRHGNLIKSKMKKNQSSISNKQNIQYWMMELKKKI
jgi:hypothetical protein